jgi:branched-chain amino acid transport system ATP-binding protein
LLVEQNALLALQLASRAYVLEVGSIVLEGEAQKLLSDEDLKEVYLGF